MQKVEGSSPFSRFDKSPAKRGFLLPNDRLETSRPAISSAWFRIGSGNPWFRAPLACALCPDERRCCCLDESVPDCSGNPRAAKSRSSADVPPIGVDRSSFFVDFGGSPFAVVDRASLGQRAPKCLLEDLDGALAHVEDLLVDGERERRFGVTH
jgi:hypothetical protein